MRVAIVTPGVDRRAGTEKAMSWLVEDLSRLCAVTLFTAELADTDASRVRVRRLSVPRRPRLVRYLAFLVANACALLWARRRGERFDVVLSTGGDCVLSDVTHAHFCAAAWSSVLDRGAARTAAAPPGQLLRLVHYRVFLRVAAFVERRLYRMGRLRAVISVSAGLRRELDAHYGPLHASVTVIPNAVDPRVRLAPGERAAARRQVRETLGIGRDEVVALFLAAGDWRRKGLAVVLEALTVEPLSPVRLLVVGHDEADAHRRLAARMKVIDRVIFAGPTDAVERSYAAADIFVYPSRYEAFPLVVLEAAGAGLPLLVTRVNGVEDLLRDGREGFFIVPDPADIAARLRLLAGDADLRARLGAAAAERSRDYDREAVARGTYDVIRSAASVAP